MNTKANKSNKESKQTGKAKADNLDTVISTGNQKLPGANNLDRRNNNDSSTDDERQRRRS
jgi:hypothetical protein